jgi:hypothetical protein
MSAELEIVLDKLEQLSLDELLFLQERIIGQVRRRTFTKATPMNEETADFPVIDIGPWPADLSLHREDMYGDDGR